MSRRNLILTNKYLYLIGQEEMKKDSEKGKLIDVIKRKLSFNQISHVSLSPLQVSSFYYIVYYIISILIISLDLIILIIRGSR